MNISEKTKNKIVKIVATFEGNNYALLETYNDGNNKRRQITYGLLQTTEDGGGLKILLAMYFAERGMYATALKRHYNLIGTGVLHSKEVFKTLLIKAAQNDPIMRTVQDEFFEREYFNRAIKTAENLGFTLPLSIAVLYDSQIHSGGLKDFLRKRFPELPPSRAKGEADKIPMEKAWIKAYLRVRSEWLENHETEILHGTRIRPNSFLSEIENDNWLLDKPFVIRYLKEGVTTKID